jgi:ferredoxin
MRRCHACSVRVRDGCKHLMMRWCMPNLANYRILYTPDIRLDIAICFCGHEARRTGVKCDEAAG